MSCDRFTLLTVIALLYPEACIVPVLSDIPFDRVHTKLGEQGSKPISPHMPLAAASVQQNKRIEVRVRQPTHHSAARSPDPAGLSHVSTPSGVKPLAAGHTAAPPPAHRVHPAILPPPHSAGGSRTLATSKSITALLYPHRNSSTQHPAARLLGLQGQAVGCQQCLRLGQPLLSILALAPLRIDHALSDHGQPAGSGPGRGGAFKHATG